MYLEVKAGTGIDALFLLQNYPITITTIDISNTMVEYMKNKRSFYHLEERWKIYQLSFTTLTLFKNKKFDLVFSNFGGLNCLVYLTRFTKIYSTKID